MNRFLFLLAFSISPLFAQLYTGDPNYRVPTIYPVGETPGHMKISDISCTEGQRDPSCSERFFQPPPGQDEALLLLKEVKSTGDKLLDSPYFANLKGKYGVVHLETLLTEVKARLQASKETQKEEAELSTERKILNEDAANIARDIKSDRVVLGTIDQYLALKDSFDKLMYPLPNHTVANPVKQ